VEASHVGGSSGLTGLTNTADDIGKKASDVLTEVKVAATQLKDALTHLNEGALSEETMSQFRRSITGLEKAMNNVSTKIVGDESAENVKAAISDVKDASAAFKRTSISLEATSTKLGETLEKLSPAVGKADKVMTSLDEALVSFKTASDNLADLTKSLGKGANKGLWGAMMNDDKLANDIKVFADNLKRNGIYRYKDDAAQQPHSPTPEPKRKGLFGR
jgi:DNA repair ATPase RecN